MTRLLLLILMGILPLISFGQSLKITGEVTDSDTGEPLVGATVLVSGSSKGTVTDPDGNYVLNNISKGDVLKFSYLGYLSKNIKVENQTNISVSLLQDEELMEEVIVVGYGTQKRENLTGAVSTVGKEKIANRPITNLATGLQGVTPGLTITRTNGEPGNEGINIQIRGVTSANGSVDPLVVIDGISTSIDALTRINPNDVEDITVLKDAAAAAIYGSQSSGGVILVTTKSGTSGKMKIDASVLYSLKRPINMPKRMTLLEEATFVNLARTNAGGGTPYSERDLENIRNNVPYDYNDSDGREHLMEFYNQTPYEDDLMYRYAPSQTYNVALSGGTEKLNYYLSGGLLNEEGMLKIGNDESKRYNARLNLRSKINEKVSLTGNIAYTNKFTNAPGDNLSGNYNTIYYLTRARLRNPLYTPSGNYMHRVVADLREGGFQNSKENRLDANATLTIKDLVKGLTLRAVVGGQYRVDNDVNFRRFVQRYSTYADGTDYENGNINSPNSYYERAETRKRANIQYLADYVLKISDKHNITALAGYEFQDYQYEGFWASASNLFNNDIAGLNHSEQENRDNGQGYNAFAFQSVFGKVNYTFDRRYVIEGTYRYDESSKLAPGYQGQDFGAISAAWNVHRESWFEGLSHVISDLKLRASWGRLGGALGSNFPNFSWANTINRGSGLVLGATDNPYYYQSAIPSSTITWENIETTNFGLDIGMFDNKLTFTGEYFTKWNKNMSTTVPVPEILGVSPPDKNIGELKVWGWEMELAYRNSFGSDFNLNIGFNLSDTQNELVKFERNTSVSEGRVGLLEGHPLNTFWGYKTNGYYSSEEELNNAVSLDGSNKNIDLGDVKYVDLNGDGEISQGEGTLEDHGDLNYIGTDATRFSFGLNIGAEYKNFDFIAFFQGVGRRHFQPNYTNLAPLTRSWIMPMDIHNDYWTPENQDALFPRPYYQATHNYQASDKWIFDAKYVRLKNIQIGYTLPKALTEKLSMDRVRVFFSGQDLLTFTNMKGLEKVYDPESRNGRISDYPYFGTASIGLNINF
ncbi:TonB-dependent receptor [Echinicola soli]|uniref:TonB-dependent receptor n=1 Tax=Echinicola soli TaxID=2591634 RepID=A0A514CIL6_9BACT|nr:TonB-dependent receptor [Echinicola soli]QDH79655.1 TonB-dependent receptor [Echinicola soli]